MTGEGDDVLARQVYVGDRYKRFGELRRADAEELARSMSGHSGGGLEKHTMPIAAAWRELAGLLSRSDQETVADLDRDEAERLAERVRVIPPGGSWLE